MPQGRIMESHQDSSPVRLLLAMTHRSFGRGCAALFACALAVAGCAHHPDTAESRNDSTLQAAWVELVPQAQARAIVTAGAACPVLVADGRAIPMALRVNAGTPAQRPAARSGEPAKAAAFPIEVCAADLPQGVRAARIDDRRLPVPNAVPARIVVTGDSGCRIKGDALQGCNDPAAWPFARVAAAAAALHPDLVIHVGDYHYRETPCPAARACAGSPWGYGWDAWQADFFAPAAPLLAAAPWVLARGNHEECARAGQGWFRLLAPEPYQVQRSCDDPRADDQADFSTPYAVPLGADTQLLVFDSAHAGNAPLDLRRPGDALIYETYRAQMREVAALADRAGIRSWFVSHHPVLGFAPDDRRPGALPYPGNQPLQTAMRSLFGTAYYPAGVQASLHGHVHLFQAIGFASNHPAALIAGNGGDSLDVSLPQPFPSDIAPAEGTVIEQITQSNSFGMLLLERSPSVPGEWRVHAYRVDGSTFARCTLAQDRSLHCEAIERR